MEERVGGIALVIEGEAADAIVDLVAVNLSGATSGLS